MQKERRFLLRQQTPFHRLKKILMESMALKKRASSKLITQAANTKWIKTVQERVRIHPSPGQRLLLEATLAAAQRTMSEK